MLGTPVHLRTRERRAPRLSSMRGGGLSGFCGPAMMRPDERARAMQRRVRSPLSIGEIFKAITPMQMISRFRRQINSLMTS